jgi:mannose/fructose/N-acetylgalactosamine-specific phosphotransferase system component IID
MYLVAIAWMYVVVMMSVAEATAPNGTVLGAIVTFFLYGVLPCVILMYLMGTPMRNRARKAKDAAELAELRAHAAAQEASDQPNAGSEPAADPIPAVRKES